jgi:hypothetical protein
MAVARGCSMIALPKVGDYVWGDLIKPSKVINIGTRKTGETLIRIVSHNGSQTIPVTAVKGIADAVLNCEIEAADGRIYGPGTAIKIIDRTDLWIEVQPINSKTRFKVMAYELNKLGDNQL